MIRSVSVPPLGVEPLERRDMLAGPDLQPLALAGWSDSIVIAKAEGTSVDAAPFTWDTSDTFYFDFALVNSGDEGAGNFFIDFVLDGVGKWQFTQNGLAPSARSLVRDISPGRLPAGDYEVRLILDPTNAVAESDESNNQVARRFTVGDNPAFRPDLALQKVDVHGIAGNPAIEPDEDVLVDLAVVNLGNGAAGGFAVDLMVNGTLRWRAERPSSSLPPGESVAWDPINLGPLGPGTHRIDVVVDPVEPGNPNGQVTEGNETNNSAGSTVTVAGEGAADLALALVQGWDSPIVLSKTRDSHTDDFPILSTDERLYVDLAIANFGVGAAGPFQIRLNLDGEPWRTFQRELPVGAGGMVDEFVDIQLGPLSPGKHTLEMRIDARNEVEERDETNNVVSRTFYVLEPASIRGAKWFDVNADGVRDPGEPGLAGWTVYLDLNGNNRPDAGEPAVQTRHDDPSTAEDETGTYAFTGLAPGTYVVAEQLPIGWEQTFPGPSGGSETGFDIEVRFLDDLFTTTQQEAILAAAARWEELIIEDIQDHYTTTPFVFREARSETAAAGLFVDDLMIDVVAGELDGTPNSGTNRLGEGGPLQGSGIDRSDGSMLPTRGWLTIDRADLSTISHDNLMAVASHEIGHVLGIGTLWDEFELVDSQGRYIGQNVIDEYNAIFGNGAQYVPLNAGGGHWLESVFGTELMTPVSDSPDDPLSRISLAALEDLGYHVDRSLADLYVPPGSSLPLVRLEGLDATASESPSGHLQWRVTRTGSTESALMVTYATSGTATPGSDYAAMSGSVTIPAGASSATIQVTLRDDATPEPAETLILSVLPSPEYGIGSPSSAAVVIEDDEPRDLSTPYRHTVTVGSGQSLDAIQFGSPPQPGDSDGNGRFDQRDVVVVLQGGKYLTGQSATWNEGDWNHDGRFDQRDIIRSLQAGNYLRGPYLASRVEPGTST